MEDEELEATLSELTRLFLMVCSFVLMILGIGFIGLALNQPIVIFAAGIIFIAASVFFYFSAEKFKTKMGE